MIVLAVSGTGKTHFVRYWANRSRLNVIDGDTVVHWPHGRLWDQAPGVVGAINDRILSEVMRYDVAHPDDALLINLSLGSLGRYLDDPRNAAEHHIIVGVVIPPERLEANWEHRLANDKTHQTRVEQLNQVRKLDKLKAFCLSRGFAVWPSIDHALYALALIRTS